MKKLLSLLLILIIMTSCLTGCKPTPEEVRDVKGMVLTSDSSTVANGGFVLGFGSYQSEDVTITKYYMYVQGIRGFRLQAIDSDYLEIVETDEVEPCIQGVFYGNGSIQEYVTYTIYVPEGTIFEEYKADASKL